MLRSVTGRRYPCLNGAAPTAQTRSPVVAVGVDPDDGDRVEVVEFRCENRVGRRRTAGQSRHLHTRQQRTASMIMSVTMSGCEVIATWEESTQGCVEVGVEAGDPGPSDRAGASNLGGHRRQKGREIVRDDDRSRARRWRGRGAGWGERLTCVGGTPGQGCGPLRRDRGNAADDPPPGCREGEEKSREDHEDRHDQPDPAGHRADRQRERARELTVDQPSPSTARGAAGRAGR